MRTLFLSDVPKIRPIQQRFGILLLLFFMLLFSVPSLASESKDTPLPYTPLEILSNQSVTDGFIEPCPSKDHICIVDRQWSIHELESRLQGESHAIWTEGNQMTFAVHTVADAVMILYGIQEHLEPVGISNYWVLTVSIRNLDQAVISHVFRIWQGNRSHILPESYGIWRGENAPPEAESSFPLKGHLQEYDLMSKELSERRTVSVYFPPNYSLSNRYPVIYMADGQSVRGFAQVLEPLILQNKVLPMLIVGVHSTMHRGDEYLLKWTKNPARYHAHEHFFTETVRLWAEGTLSAGTIPEMRAIMGYSNGADFAGTTTIRKPDLYGATMIFSAGFVPDMRFDENIKSRFFLTAGTLETGFYQSTSTFARMLTAIGVPTQFRSRVAGHDWVLWQEEFVNAIQWFYGLE